jgi:5-hydroxyisourate hydrolase
MISTHILDTTRGNPASEVQVSLDFYDGSEWKQLDRQKTNSDGRIVFKDEGKVGVYRLTFELDPYFERFKQEHFFVRTPVIFQIKDNSRKYHVPLLLNPYGYSTYRGS